MNRNSSRQPNQRTINCGKAIPAIDIVAPVPMAAKTKEPSWTRDRGFILLALFGLSHGGLKAPMATSNQTEAQ